MDHQVEKESRWWIIDYALPGEPNKIIEASEATGMNLVGIVDEEAGGVIGYMLPDFAELVCRQLNAIEEIKAMNTLTELKS